MCLRSHLCCRRCRRCRTRARLRYRMLHGFAREVDELLGSFELTILIAESFEFQPQSVAGHGRESAAELRSNRSAQEAAQCGAGDG